MLAQILATACLMAAPSLTAPFPPTTATVTPDGDPLKALEAWLKLYSKGKIEIYSTKILNHVPLQVDWKETEITAKQSFAVKYGLAPKTGLGESTWLGDIEAIASALATTDTAAAAQALLELAAVGLDDQEYRRELAPDVVRGVGESWLAKLKSKEARDLVAAAARGELKLGKAQVMPMRGAAARCLGSFADPEYRTTLEPLLGVEDATVRYHAAAALGRLGDDASAMALIDALGKEQSEVVLPAIVDSLRAIYAPYLPKLASSVDADKSKVMPESSRLAARAAIGAIGRSTWRSDMALLRFLDDFRSKDAVPALIALLERYHQNPEQVQAGQLSTLVLHRAHELLVSMTGAVFPADETDKWRDLWNRESEKIEVQKRHEAAPDGNTAASGFAGIPVQGSRVLFIVDLSRSMTFAMTKSGQRTGKAEPEPATRIDYARRELYRAVDELPENASFNMVTFNGEEKAKAWNKAMVPATEKNRQRFKKFVADMEPDGGTNLWSALELALKTKSLVFGDRYESNCDEIFILSDGAPSVGEVLNPTEILRLVKESNRFAGMRINTVFISSPNEEERRNPAPWMGETKPEELMQRLASENGGKCVILKD